MRKGIVVLGGVLAIVLVSLAFEAGGQAARAHRIVSLFHLVKEEGRAYNLAPKGSLEARRLYWRLLTADAEVRCGLGKLTGFGRFILEARVKTENVPGPEDGLGKLPSPLPPDASVRAKIDYITNVGRLHDSKLPPGPLAFEPAAEMNVLIAAARRMLDVLYDRGLVFCKKNKYAGY